MIGDVDCFYPDLASLLMNSSSVDKIKLARFIILILEYNCTGYQKLALFVFLVVKERSRRIYFVACEHPYRAIWKFGDILFSFGQEVSLPVLKVIIMYGNIGSFFELSS